jgi:hypothetical protein
VESRVGDCADEPVAVTRNGLDEGGAVLIVAQYPPDGTDRVLDRILSPVSAPDGTEQLILGYHACAMFDEEVERPERGWGKSDAFLSLVQGFGFGIENIVAKPHTHERASALEPASRNAVFFGVFRQIFRPENL